MGASTCSPWIGPGNPSQPLTQTSVKHLSINVRTSSEWMMVIFMRTPTTESFGTMTHGLRTGLKKILVMKLI